MEKADGRNMTDELLYRHFAGQLDDALTGSVLAWKEESEKNRLEYERAHIFYLDTQALAHRHRQEKAYDTQAAWKKVRAQNRKKIPQARPYFRLVASVVLLLVFGLTYYLLIKADQVTVAAHQERLIQELPDGSGITLNVGAELRYPEKFRGNTREVELKGEAYFEVEASKEKPFVIKVDDLQVVALGTAFNIKAIESNDTITVSVDEGIVHMIYKTETKELKTGERGLFIRNVAQLQIVPVERIATYNYWRTKRLNFYGNTLIEVVQSIEQIYEVKVDIANTGIGECKITVNFENESVENVLDIIAATLNLEVSNQNGIYLLTGEGCDG